MDTKHARGDFRGIIRGFSRGILPIPVCAAPPPRGGARPMFNCYVLRDVMDGSVEALNAHAHIRCGGRGPGGRGERAAAVYSIAPGLSRRLPSAKEMRISLGLVPYYQRRS